ncbi:hypothetical protein [Streptomyces sp. f150]|uniref:hypothetical protein n=1 Tax=Streptomyces sp. f150 TaxID=1827699 RepID=UPI00117F1945|nr:hypothetical protein [Streptomyces sp. f150]
MSLRHPTKGFLLRGDALGVAAGLLDQAFDTELYGGTSWSKVLVVDAAPLLCCLANMTAEYRRATA